MKRSVSTCAPWLLAALALVSCGRDGGSGSGGSGDGRPNVVLISIDTCRADALGCYSPGRRTPNLDSLAEKSAVFLDAIAPAPVTLPSHSSMLTGTNPPYHGVHDNTDYRLGEFHVSFAEIARDAGYATSAVVGAYMLAERFGLEQGFDSYDDGFASLDTSRGVVERPAEEVSQSALSWLDQRPEGPFFLFLHYYDPHQVYDPPAPFRRGESERELYDGEVAYVDHCIGQVIERLKELDLFDSTLIVVTSDHGEMLEEHGESTHGYFVYQSALHVPLLFKLPGVAEARRIAGRVGLVDIVPTLCAQLGLPLPEEVHGSDLSPHMSGAETRVPDRFLYYESMMPTLYDASPLIGIVSERWKYIHTSRPELYDLESDPGEARDLAQSEPDRARALRDRLAQLVAEQHLDAEHSKQLVNAEEMEKIQALGYVGGGVRESFDLDAMVGGNDPKDTMEFFQADQLLYKMLHEERIAEAYELGKQLVAQRPDSIHTRLQMTWVAMQVGKPEECIEHARRILDLDPEHPRGHFAMGRGLEELGQLDGAAEHFEKVLQFWPEDVDAHSRLGRIALVRKDPATAVEHLEAAYRIDPEFEAVALRLGNALVSTGEWARALECLDTALRLDPEAVQAHYLRGVALESSNRPADALAAYRRALQLEPGLSAAQQRVAVLLDSQGQGEDAEAAYLRSIAAQPTVEAHVNLGVLYGRRGALDQAIEQFRKALAIDPEAPQANAQLGVAMRMKGETDEAIRLLTRAAAADPRNVQTLFALGRAHEDAGQLESAARQYEKALEIAPGDTTLGEALARVRPR